MVQRWAPAKRFTAIGALVVPGEVDLITRRATGDEPRLVNVVLVHDRLGRAGGRRKRRDPRCRHRWG